ncbi:MAG: DUF6080 domain-containing protein [Cytophagaceae bacterium]|jgi:hypothetical protein|nr:DUF6080 domain-containing protein [Cytophagaceae bacterium]
MIKALLWIKKELQHILKSILPLDKIEWILFIFFFGIYAVCGLTLVFGSDMLYNTSIRSGSYLGYDNIFHYKTAGGALDVSHPFINLFHFAKFVIGKCLSFIFGARGAIVFCVLLMNFLVTSTLTVLYKYLKNIAKLPVYRSLLLTVFCASFFTVIILSFTVETYPFAFLFLMLSLYILSKKYVAEKKFGFSTVLIFEFLCGGITITNAIKPLLAFLLNKESIKTVFRNQLKATIPFVVAVTIVFIFYSLKSVMIDNNHRSMIEIINSILSYLHFDKEWLKQIFMDYWSSSILVAPLTAQTVGAETVLRPSVYLHLWQYLFSGSILLIFIASLVLNRKNTLVKLLFFYILIDIIIHFVFRYGLNEAIIFGGHWLFLVPMLTGWLYSFFKTWKGVTIAMDVYITVCILVLLYNNAGEILVKIFG